MVATMTRVSQRALRLCSEFVWQARMVSPRGHAVFLEKSGDFLGSFLARHVHDRRASDGGETGEQEVFPLTHCARRDAEVEVWPVKTELGVICGGDAEMVANFPRDLGRSGGGEREHALDFQLATETRQFQII
jgi:hypothetical protein